MKGDTTSGVCFRVPFFIYLRRLVMIKINGKAEESAAGKSIAEYLEQSGYKATRVAVEINGDILPKAEYSQRPIAEGDTIEIVSFVGGG